MGFQSLTLVLIATRVIGLKHNLALQQTFSFSNREICPSKGSLKHLSNILLFPLVASFRTVPDENV